MIGVCFYKKFLSNNKYVTIDNVVDHVDYISNLVGSEFVGIGSDFDGMENEDKPQDLKSVLDIKKIEEKLEKRGFSPKEINNIMGENYIRILNENLK
jgi:membrane dipeptidase